MDIRVKKLRKKPRVLIRYSKRSRTEGHLLLVAVSGTGESSFRAIKEGSGVSLGTVKNVMDELQARGYLLTIHRKRSLKNARRLLDDWAENYAIILKPKLLLRRFAFRNAEQKEAWQTLSHPQGIWWGGECAASEKQGYLHREYFTIYSEVLPAQLMETGAVRMEEGEITLYEKFWQGDEMPAVLV